MPVWGVWLDRCLWFSTGGRSRKARNLRADPRCTVHTDGEDPVIVHGTAEVVTEPEALAGLMEAYGRKYPDVAARPGGEPDRARAAAVGVRADRARVRHQPDALDVLSLRANVNCGIKEAGSAGGALVPLPEQFVSDPPLAAVTRTRPIPLPSMPQLTFPT